MTSSLRDQIWCGGVVCPDALGGLREHASLFLSWFVFVLVFVCVVDVCGAGRCVCVCVRELGCDWLSARPDVSQLLIREAMKGPPL